MIYLIGGAPRCGKTILSKQLAKQKNISYLSTDTIRHMIVACTPHRQRGKKFPIELHKSATPYNNLNTLPPRILLKNDITESKSIWPSTRRLIEDLVESQEDFIVEGVHLMPMFVQHLRATLIWKQIKLIYVVKTNIDDILSGFQKNTSKHDWLAGALHDQDLLKKVTRMVQVESLYITQQARKFGFPVVDTGMDFEKKLRSVAKEL